MSATTTTDPQQQEEKEQPKQQQQQPQQQQQQHEESSTANSSLVKIFFCCCYLLVAIVSLIMLLELPFGSISQSLLRAAIDPYSETRFMCSNCTYLVNRLDIIAHRKATKASEFDSQVRSVCPAIRSGAGTTTSKNKKKKGAASKNNSTTSGGGGFFATLSSLTPPSMWHFHSGSGSFCRALYVFYRQQLRQRFTTVVKSSAGRQGKQPGQFPRVVSTAPDFCRTHCRSKTDGELGSLMERWVLANIDVVQRSPRLAGAIVFVRHWGRVVLLGWLLFMILVGVLWARVTAAQRYRQVQQIDRRLRLLRGERAILCAALETAPWNSLGYDEQGDPDLQWWLEKQKQELIDRSNGAGGGAGGGGNGSNGSSNGNGNGHHHAGGASISKDTTTVTNTNNIKQQHQTLPARGGGGGGKRAK